MPSVNQFKNLASRMVSKTFSEFTNTFEIEMPVKLSDDQGGFTVSWVEFASVRGFVKIESGDEVQKDGRLKSDYPTKFSFEYISGIENDMRILYNGEQYNIVSIENVVESGVWVNIIADKADAT